MLLFRLKKQTSKDVADKNFNSVVIQLFIGGRKLNIPLVFVTQSYFAAPKNIRLTSIDYFVKEIPSKRELQKFAFNYLSYIDFKDFMNFYKKMYNKTTFFFSY